MRCRRNLAPQSALVPAQTRCMVDETLQICISVPPRRGATRGAIVRFYWFPCIHMKDALRNKAYKQKDLADAVDAGKALRCAQLYDMGKVACGLHIFPVQTLELTEKGTTAASVFLRVVQRIVRVLVDAVAGIGAIGERGACAQRHLRHAIDGLR